METLNPNQRDDWNGILAHMSQVNAPIQKAADYVPDYNKLNPKSTLTPDHIPVALSEIAALKSGNPIGGMDSDHAKFINSGLTTAYKNNPNNLNYPISAVHGTDIEKHLPPEDPHKVKIDDKRAISAATGAKIEPGQTTGTYNADTIRNVIKAAKHVGIDPNLALAVALQESHLGQKSPDNLGNVSSAGYSKIPAGLDPQAYTLAAFLKEKMEAGKKLGYTDEAHLIQMYNGMGKLKPNMSVGGVPQPMKYYGIEVTKDKLLDLKKNPLYGKTIQDLRDNVIRKNTRIQRMLHEG